MTFHKQIKNRNFCQHLWDQFFSLCDEMSAPNFLSPALLYKRNLLNADTHSDPAVMGLVFSEGVASIRRLVFITF